MVGLFCICNFNVVTPRRVELLLSGWINHFACAERADALTDRRRGHAMAQLAAFSVATVYKPTKKTCLRITRQNCTITDQKHQTALPNHVTYQVKWHIIV